MESQTRKKRLVLCEIVPIYNTCSQISGLYRASTAVFGLLDSLQLQVQTSVRNLTLLSCNNIFIAYLIIGTINDSKLLQRCVA